jgi:ceramide glucosyltransferase
VLLSLIFGGLALLSLCLTLWQWVVARSFPLHRRVAIKPTAPAVTLLKPLKGCDATTEACLRSWLTQQYPAPVQVLFGVASDKDPVCNVVKELLREFPTVNAELIICGPLSGTNLKVSKLMQMERLAKHEVVVVSDADVRVSPDFLVNVTAPLEREQIGLVNCFYRLANPANMAMAWETIAINSDFWSQVLQAQSLKPLDFALGAVMATRLRQLQEIGGFASLKDCLADDYQLGKRIAQHGHKIVLCPVVVECWSEPMQWPAVWKHQLRWGRTIRVCQPVAYFFSILSNATLWPMLWVCVERTERAILFACICLVVRIATALDQQRMLTQTRARLQDSVVILLKDVLHFAIWLLSFLGNRIEWRGERLRLRPDGTLVRG